MAPYFPSSNLTLVIFTLSVNHGVASTNHMYKSSVSLELIMYSTLSNLEALCLSKKSILLSPIMQLQPLFLLLQSSLQLLLLVLLPILFTSNTRTHPFPRCHPCSTLPLTKIGENQCWHTYTRTLLPPPSASSPSLITIMAITIITHRQLHILQSRLHIPLTPSR